MQKLELLYEGKAKKVFTTVDNDKLIVDYKDSATAFNGEKKGTIKNKGIINNQISNHLMMILEENDIKTHLIEEISDRETIVKRVTIFPIEVLVRNIAAGSLSKRLGLEEGTVLNKTVLEYCYKDDALGDPMINDYHIFALNLATREELKVIEDYAFKINNILCKYFENINITLVDFKLEFGKLNDNTIVLADEISPDTCRFWDMTTKDKLDKDRFRRSLGNEEDAYIEMYNRIIKDKKTF